MSKDPNYYQCDLPPDMSLYDHLPYHLNTEINDGTHINLFSGNILRGCPVNYTDKRIIVPNEEYDES